MGLQLAAHLPLIQFDETPITRSRILQTARTAASLDFWGISANDHVIFSRPWIDGPSALAISIPHAGELRICTTVSLPTIRGPLPLAKTLISLNALAGAGWSPASAPAPPPVITHRSVCHSRSAGSASTRRRGSCARSSAARRQRTASTTRPRRSPGSCSRARRTRFRSGSGAGARRPASAASRDWRTAGWPRATTPLPRSSAPPGHLDRELSRQGKASPDFPNGLATMWLWVTEDRSEAERMLADVLGPAVKRDPDYLRPRVCVGPADHCLDLLSRYAEAGLQRVFLWPLGDEPRQLELVAEKLMPALMTT